MLVLCDLETYLCPRAVLVKRQDKREAFSSEAQARVRGSTRQPLTTASQPDDSVSTSPGQPAPAAGESKTLVEVTPWADGGESERSCGEKA